MPDPFRWRMTLSTMYTMSLGSLYQPSQAMSTTRATATARVEALGVSGPCTTT
jgi:hypothetical protein